MTTMDIANELIDVWRYSYKLYSGSAVNAVAIGINPSAEALIKVTLDSAQTGTLYLNGSTTEILTFTASSLEKSVNLFTTLSGVTPSGLTGNMNIECFDESNDPVRSLIYMNSIYGYVKWSKDEIIPTETGLRTNHFIQLFTSEDVDIQNEDILIRSESKLPISYVANNVMRFSGIGDDGHVEMMLTRKI